MALRTTAPNDFWGVVIIIVVLIIGLIVGTVLASQSCKKDEKSKFGNLLDTLKTAAEGTKAATQTLGEAIGISGGSKEEEFTSVGAVDPLATVKLYVGLFGAFIVIAAIVYIYFFGEDGKKSDKTSMSK